MTERSLARVASGIPGLDDILRGGFVSGRHYPLRGPPGTGKTILSFHFLTAGGDDETALMINIEESTADVRANASTLGFDLDGVTGEFQATDAGSSYLADNVLFLRYHEIEGELRKAIGVLKKRIRDFENTLRAFEITGDGVVVGDPLSGYRGVLRGTPAPHDRRTHDE
jgi:KaiC/GvpD/RAD55 family RecA-like ATPase